MPFPIEVTRTKITEDQMILSVDWGEITGNVTSQTDLIELLNTKSDNGHTHFLNELANVDLYTAPPQNGYVLYYDSGSNKWKSKALPVNITALSELTDVDVTTTPPQNGFVLTYLNNKWRPSQIPDTGGAQYLNDLLDVDLLTILPSNNDILIYDGTNHIWKPSAMPSISGATKLSELTDVNTVLYPPQNGNVLIFDASLNMWRPEELSITIDSLGDIGDVNLYNLDYGNVIIWEGSRWINATLDDANIAVKSHTHDANQINYNNTLSGLTSNLVQDAIDELNINITNTINTLNNNVSTINDRLDTMDSQIAANTTSITSLSNSVNNDISLLNDSISTINSRIDSEVSTINTRIGVQKKSFVTAAGQTEFDISDIYSATNFYIAVYRNGVLMLDDLDYVLDTVNKKITFNYTCNLEDLVVVVQFSK